MPILGNVFSYLKNGATIEANVNGSVTPVVYSYTAAKNLYLSRMIVYIEDSGAITASAYGALATLANGIDVEHTSGSDVTDLLDGVPIKSNAGWAALCYDATEVSFSGGGNGAVSVRWTFGNSGRPLYLETGDTLRIRVNDDLTGLIAHRFQIQGYPR